MTDTVYLDQDQSLLDIERVITGHSVIDITEQRRAELDASFDFFSQKVYTEDIYGVNTGLGPMVRVPVASSHLDEQQRSLLNSHAAGLGDPISERFSKAVLLARAKSLSANRSAVRSALPRQLIHYLRAGISPVIPRHGGVGASGDLVQLAHLGLSVIGTGDVWCNGSIVPAQHALEHTRLEPLELQFREGLAIINGVSAMTGVGLVNVLDAELLFDRIIALGALMFEITAADRDALSVVLNTAKRHEGQQRVAQQLRERLNDSQAFVDERLSLTGDRGRPLQEHYSIRCLPQVLGTILESIESAKATLLNEFHSVSDNPVFCPREKRIAHGGNFHGEPVAQAMDQLKLAMVKMTMLAERQLNFLLNDDVNKILPPFLNGGTLGVDFGLQGAQFTAVSTTAYTQSLAYPMAAHSISSNKDNQDIVSMGFDAAVMTHDVITKSDLVQSILSVGVQSAVRLLELEDVLSTQSREFLNTLPPAPPDRLDTPLNKALAQASVLSA